MNWILKCLQKAQWKGESRQRILQGYGVLTPIFTQFRIPIPDGIANPNTNIPFIEDYYEFSTMPSSLTASLKSYKKSDKVEIIIIIPIYR